MTHTNWLIYWRFPIGAPFTKSLHVEYHVSPTETREQPTSTHFFFTVSNHLTIETPFPPSKHAALPFYSVLARHWWYADRITRPSSAVLASPFLYFRIKWLGRRIRQWGALLLWGGVYVFHSVQFLKRINFFCTVDYVNDDAKFNFIGKFNIRNL